MDERTNKLQNDQTVISAACPGHRRLSAAQNVWTGEDWRTVSRFADVTTSSRRLSWCRADINYTTTLDETTDLRCALQSL